MLLLTEDCLCIKCKMPPVPANQLREGDLPVCFGGHTLLPPVIPVERAPDKVPPLSRIGRPTAENAKERGRAVKARAEALKITLNRLGAMVGRSESSAYNASGGQASEALLSLLEAKLDELEKKQAKKEASIKRMEEKMKDKSCKSH